MKLEFAAAVERTSSPQSSPLWLSVSLVPPDTRSQIRSNFKGLLRSMGIRKTSIRLLNKSLFPARRER
jgi:hypothetical protein